MNGLRGATRFKNDGITVGSPGSGTVTSVDLFVPTDILAVTGGPITTSGAFTVTKAATSQNTIYAGSEGLGTLPPTFRTMKVGDLPGAVSGTATTVAANLVYAGPATGAAAIPTFRAPVAADIPNLDASKITTGTLPIARGGTNSGTALSGGVNVLMVSSGTGITELVGAQVSSTDGYISGNQIRGINGGAMFIAGTVGATTLTAATTPPIIVFQDPDGISALTFDSTFQLGSVYTVINQMTGSSVQLLTSTATNIGKANNVGTGASVVALFNPPTTSAHWAKW